MLRSSCLTLLIGSGVAWSCSISFAGEVAKTSAKPVAKRPTAPVSATTVSAPQRLTGFYHPNGVGVSATTTTVVEPTPTIPNGQNAIPSGPPAMPMTPGSIGGGYGQPTCGCAHPYATWDNGAGMMIGGGYGGYMPHGLVDPYALHFGPGYPGYGMEGHVRFPYYSYRWPQYNPGHPSFNRDVNMPW